MDKKQRIGSIDALRGFALLGIILVHSMAYFGYTNGNINDFSFVTPLGDNISRAVYFLIEGRCNKVFSTLFGISFFLILRNPEYTSGRFIWRCVLLAFFGWLNKFFYTNDTLIWYGILGCILTCFRKCSPKQLFVLFVILFIASWFPLQLYDFTPNPPRYIFDQSLYSLVSYPLVYGYADWFAYFPTSDLAFFVLGYSIGKKGIIEHIPDYLTKKNYLLFGTVYFLLLAMSAVKSQIALFETYPFVKESVLACRDLFGSIFYVLLFMAIYYKWPTKFKAFECYGKLGLTNYSFQGVFGVIISLYIVIPLQLSREYAVIVFLGLYFAQMQFSVIWLKYFKNGPMEWLWRCMTSLKYSSPFIKKQSL